MLEHVDRWLEQWRRPIWEALYRRDEAGCRNELAQAEIAWDAYAVTTDEREAARLYLDFLTCQVDESFKPVRDLKRGLVLEALEQLAKPVETPLAITMQARVLLTLRCWAHVQSIHPLSREEVDRWYKIVPEEDRDHQLMSYIAFWAFSRREQGYLEACYRYFLTQPVEFMVDFSRQRAKVMLLLAENRCQHADLEKLIGLAPHLMHLQWIGRHVAGPLMERGLWNTELQEQLELKIRGLRDSTPEVPPRDEPPGFVINI